MIYMVKQTDNVIANRIQMQLWLRVTEPKNYLMRSYLYDNIKQQAYEQIKAKISENTEIHIYDTVKNITLEHFLKPILSL